MDQIDVVDLKTLRKKYLKTKFRPSQLDSGVETFFNKHTGELEIEFSHLVKWSGDEYNYTVVLCLDDNSVIQKISALKCERLCFDDATGSEYKGKRVDEYDYYRLDCVLSQAQGGDEP